MDYIFYVSVGLALVCIVAQALDTRRKRINRQRIRMAELENQKAGEEIAREAIRSHCIAPGRDYLDYYENQS